ncbi:MAG: hypothetical protein WBJ81_05055 [Rickettsiales bacterium]
MPQDIKIKSAFRIYSKESEQFGLLINWESSSVLNSSHPERDNLRLLGSEDKEVCQAEEFCPNVNILYTYPYIDSKIFINLDFIVRFKNHIITEDIIKLIDTDPNHEITKVIKNCELSINKKLTSDLIEEEKIQFGKCLEDSTSVMQKHQNNMFNCIGFAFGIKEFITADVYTYKQPISIEKNVKNFIYTLNKKYSDKPSNIMELLEKVDSEATDIKCYGSFEEFYQEHRVYQNNDIILYFTNNFHKLLHGARFVTELTEDIKVDSFISKLGHGHLISHSAIDAFNRNEYGDELCYISGNSAETSGRDEL